MNFKKLILTIPISFLTLVPVVACAQTSTNEVEDDLKTKLKEQQSLINEAIAKQSIYLNSPNRPQQWLNTNEEFNNVNETNLFSLIQGFDQVVDQSQWTLVDFTNHNLEISFKIRLGDDLWSDQIHLMSPTLMFDKLLNQSVLVQPINKLALADRMAISSGKQNQASAQDQVAAIAAYVKNQWKLTKLDQQGHNFKFALSANTNNSFYQVFNQNWQDVFAKPLPLINQPLVKQVLNDFQAIGQVVIGFKVEQVAANSNQNGIAKWNLVLQFVQLGWTKNLPTWLLPNQNSYRYLLNDLKISLNVKNTSQSAGSLVSQ